MGKMLSWPAFLSRAQERSLGWGQTWEKFRGLWESATLRTLTFACLWCPLLGD